MPTKPPIGLKPKYIHDANVLRSRASEILAAMHRYSEGEKVVPAEWIAELSGIILEITKNQRGR